MATYSWTSDADQDATILRARTESNLAAADQATLDAVAAVLGLPGGTLGPLRPVKA